MITANNEVCSAVILADNSVPDSLTGSAHAHGKGQETQHGHAVGVAGQQGLVHADAGEVVDVTGLGQANDGVDQHVGLTGAGGADSELAVSTVHGVARLESDDLGPAKLVEVETELSGSVWSACQYEGVEGRAGEAYSGDRHSRSAPTGQWHRPCHRRRTRSPCCRGT
jgi:hypothetical protein